MEQKFDLRYAANPTDVKSYDTERLRKEFAITDLMKEDEVTIIYSMYDRFVTGGVVPVKGAQKLETIDAFKSEYFLARRELGIINVGQEGTVTVDGEKFTLQYKEALYVAMGAKEVLFESNDSNNPARYYFNSTPAHQSFAHKLVTRADAEVVNLGSMETCNARTINKLIVNSVVETCQLQMGMTELAVGSVWNTLPAHVHDRRMEVYFYFEVPEGQAVSHFMGQPQETRHIFLQNEQAVISPSWSIHSGAGTSNYTFVWGMAGENLDYGDMDHVQIPEMR